MVGISAPPAIGDNPFVGPRPFEEGRRIFGRDREIEDLYHLLSAERIVLLYSPSGAGKSSLVQAGLIPRLRAGGFFDVWKTTRVNQSPQEQPPGVNRYLHSAMRGFEQGVPEERRRSPEEIAGQTLTDYVATRPRRPFAPNNIVLIFDQFEEILTADPLDVEAKREFFAQVGQMLLAPHVWALFALREDYLAPLDPYADLVPTHLKNCFRLDLLRDEDACEAIIQTASQGGLAGEGGRAFDPEAARKLVHDLATINVQQPDGSFLEQTGRYVEPLQLQVVCRGLWAQMPPEQTRIEPEDIKQYGNVIESLAGYYQSEVARIAAGNAQTEQSIREWVGERLITPEGIRIQVLKGKQRSEGLRNELIDSLVQTYLVRREERDGATWYELAHDRLIVPIRRNNEAWWSKQIPLLRAVQQWKKSDRDKRYLFLGEQLQDILKQRDLIPNDPTVALFLEACNLAEGERQYNEKMKQQQDRLVTRMAIVLGIFSLPVLLLIAIFTATIIVTQGGILEKALAYGLILVAISVGVFFQVIIGGPLGWLGLRLYRSQSVVKQALFRLARKHRLDRSLQGAVDLFEDPLHKTKVAAGRGRPPQSAIDASGPFDAWETRTLQFAPLWAFLAVAGVDGLLNRRETKAILNALRRSRLRSNPRFGPVFRPVAQNSENTIAEFVSDDRETVRGLEDVAAILRAKASEQEAANFKEEILQLTDNIAKWSRGYLGLFTKRGDKAKDNRAFVAEVLSGQPTLIARPERYRYYRHSGIYSTSGMLLAFALGLLAASLFAWPYYSLQKILLVRHLIILLPLQILLAGLYGGLIGKATYWGLNWGRVRNPLAVNTMAIVNALMAVVMGCWRIFKSQHNASWHWLIILGEAALIFWTIFIISRRGLSRTYCEQCGTSSVTTPGVLTLIAAADFPGSPASYTIAELKQHLEEGKFSFLEPLARNSSYALNASQWLRLDLQSCPGCKQFCTLTVNAVAAHLDARGQRRETTTLVMKRLLITPRSAAWIGALAERINTPLPA